MYSWGGEKVEVLSLVEWERKRLSGLNRGERVKGKEVGHFKEGALRFEKEAKKKSERKRRKALERKAREEEGKQVILAWRT